ncbi:MAG: hypothetical protein ACMXYC_02035 [Candidatus Woesearchaeota archaeon]
MNKKQMVYTGVLTSALALSGCAGTYIHPSGHIKHPYNATMQERQAARIDTQAGRYVASDDFEVRDGQIHFALRNYDTLTSKVQVARPFSGLDYNTLLTIGVTQENGEVRPLLQNQVLGASQTIASPWGMVPVHVATLDTLEQRLQEKATQHGFENPQDVRVYVTSAEQQQPPSTFIGTTTVWDPVTGFSRIGSRPLKSIISDARGGQQSRYVRVSIPVQGQIDGEAVHTAHGYVSMDELRSNDTRFSMFTGHNWDVTFAPEPRPIDDMVKTITNPVREVLNTMSGLSRDTKTFVNEAESWDSRYNTWQLSQQ